MAYFHYLHFQFIPINLTQTGSGIAGFIVLIGQNSFIDCSRSSRVKTQAFKNKAYLRHQSGVDETGICMNHYRQNVMSWYDGNEKQELSFARMMRGKMKKEVSRHLLALLHLANEEKIEISSEPLAMDGFKFKKIAH